MVNWEYMQIGELCQAVNEAGKPILYQIQWHLLCKKVQNLQRTILESHKNLDAYCSAKEINLTTECGHAKQIFDCLNKYW